MPDTQAYSVDWTVSIQPEGDVSADVAELKILQEDKKPDSATVVLDTSEKPHALKERKDITITVDDGNNAVKFDGVTDSVKDDETKPIVTIDAREREGLLDDVHAVGLIDADNLFRVIDELVNNTAGQIREISFDPASLESNYGTFGSSTNFGSLKVKYYPLSEPGASTETFTQNETLSGNQEYEVELRIDSYENDTGTIYTLDITGEDADGNTVKASLDLPPGTDADDAFDTDVIKLGLVGGNQRFQKVTGVDTNIPNDEATVYMNAKLWNYVKTRWRFKADAIQTVNEALDRLVSYISGLDNANGWEYFVDQSGELIVQPESSATPDKYVFKEADNVLKPVANRDLDGVRNFVKVNGANTLNIWAWAYDNSLYYSIFKPFENGKFPDSAIEFESDPDVTSNHIDQINLRAEALKSNSITSLTQALDLAKKALRQYLRTPVSGKAPVAGIHPANPGDDAEIYFPSRGIPSMVADNVYRIKKVEYTITPEKAKTTMDFGTAEPNLGDMIAAGGQLGRTDISRDIQQLSTGVGAGTGNVGAQVVGELDSQNSDGTWRVIGEDGNTYDNVRVI